MSRKAFVCRDTPGGVHCMTVIVGDEVEQVVERAAEHMIELHDLDREPELREVILAALSTEDEVLADEERRDRFDMVHVHPHPPEEDVDDETAVREGFTSP